VTAAAPRIRTVAVCGGGHGALATAGDLARRGYEVRLALRNTERFAELFRTRRLRLEGALEAEVELAEVTSEHASILPGAELVIVPLPAPAQLELAARIAPRLEEGQVLYVTKGTFGAPAIRRLLRSAGAPEVPIAENAILPYGARVSGPASVRVGLVASHLPTAVFPADRAGEVLPRLAEVYPATEPAVDVLDVALLNVDPGLHPPLVVLNAGPLEALDAFDLHVDGTPPAVVRASVALDRERIALREALGYPAPHWPLADLYSRERETYYGVLSRERLARHSVWREKIGLDHRYLREDVGCGLVLWTSLGQRLGLETPLAEAFVRIASALLGEDLAADGRTLESLGLGRLDPQELRELLAHGE
jgi:opine dehydrogenase